MSAGTWEGLFEFIMWKSVLLLGMTRALDFIEDLCNASRFACLKKNADELADDVRQHIS